MSLEGPITDISDLNPAWPVDSNEHAITDDNLRKCKEAAKKSFLSLGSDGGVVTLTATQFNSMQGVTANVQQQITEKLPSWTLFNSTSSETDIYDPMPGESVLIRVTSNGTRRLRLPESPPDGTQVLARIFRLDADYFDNWFFIIRRKGVNTLTNLDTGTANLTSITAPSEFITWHCVYFSNVWYCWPLEGG